MAEKAKSYIDVDDPIAYSPENLILLGDFNIFDRTDATFDALTKNKFIVPPELLKLKGSNALETKFYDQIAFYKETKGIQTTSAGIFNFYKYVFNDAKTYSDAKLVPPKSPFDTWKTFQMSDHLLMWTEFDVDKTDTYLRSLVKSEATAAATTSRVRKKTIAKKKSAKKTAKKAKKKVAKKKVSR